MKDLLKVWASEVLSFLELHNMVKKNILQLFLTDIVIAIWFRISRNDNFFVIIFTEKLLTSSQCDICWGLNQTNMFFLHLENNIYRTEHLCSTTVLHYDAYLSPFVLPLSKKWSFLPFGLRTYPHCNSFFFFFQLNFWVLCLFRCSSCLRFSEVTDSHPGRGFLQLHNELFIKRLFCWWWSGYFCSFYTASSEFVVI